MKKILTVLFSLFIVFGLVGANPKYVSADVQWSEWSTTKTGRTGEQEKTQYSSREFQGWESSATAKNSESKLVQIYYKDIEYYVIDNYNFLSTSVSSSSGGKNIQVYYKTANNTKPALTNWTTTDQTIYQNKWNFQPTGTSTHWGAGYGSYGSTAFSVSHTVTEYYGDHGGQTTGTNKKNLGGQILEYNGQVYGSSIIGMGVQADSPWGYRTGFYNGNTYEDGMIEYNEYNTWQEPDGRKVYGGATSWWSGCAVTGDDDMCYDYRGGNKTALEYYDVFSTITDTNGRQITLPGIAGNYGLYLISRKFGQGVSEVGATNEVKVKKMSLIERTYYIDYDGTQTKNVVSKTYLTPKWGPWSAYQDSAITATNNRQVRTRKLYRYPLGYYIKYNANGGSPATIESTYKPNGENVNLTSTKPSKANHNFLGWDEACSAKTPTYSSGQLFTKELNSDITLCAIYEGIGKAQVEFYDDTTMTTIKKRAIVQGVDGTDIKDDAYIDDLNYYLARGYEVLQNGMEDPGKYSTGVTKNIRVSLIHTYTVVDKETYEKGKCLNEACTVTQPEKKPGC